MAVTRKPLKTAPVEAKDRAQIDALKQEIRNLQAENAELKEELAQFIENWETLDGDAVRTLIWLARNEAGHAREISQAHQMNLYLVESYLRHLESGGYVHPPQKGAKRYALAPKGKRYLRERGLHK